MMNLNESQAHAARSIEGPMMVMAGPGTGKTQLLTARIESILKESGLSAKNILCLTYTDAGAHAMRERLLQKIGPEAYAISIETFHAFCVRLLQEYPEAFGSFQSTRQVESLEAYQMIHAWIKKLEVARPFRQKFQPEKMIRDILSAIASLKKENFSPDAFQNFLNEYTLIPSQLDAELELVLGRPARQAFTDEEIETINHFLAKYSFFAQDIVDADSLDRKARTAYRNHWRDLLKNIVKNAEAWRDLEFIYRHYQDEMKKKGLYDYDDMVLWVIDQFEKDASFLAGFQETYQYILVDEYQDTNGSQSRLMYLLAGGQEGAPNLFVVGDDKQSIYRFQGASVENMEGFAQAFENNVQLVTLNQNYRSTQAILDAADALIAHNQALLEKFHLSRELHANSQAPNLKPLLLTYPEFKDQYYACAAWIQKSLEEGVSASEIAVLYRNHRDADDLVAILQQKNIPFHRKLKRNILELSWVKAWLAYLACILHPEKSTLTFAVLSHHIFGVDEADLLRLSLYGSRHRNLFWMDILGDPFHLNEAGISAESSLRSFFAKVAERRQALANETASTWFLETARRSGLFQFALGDKSRHQLFIELQSLYQDFKDFLKKDPAHDVEAYLKKMELHAFYQVPLEIAERPSAKNAVQLMTAHGSKGLEFERVMILNVSSVWSDKGRQQSSLSLPRALVSLRQDEAVELEESRRLFYVAMTRAKKELVFLNAQYKQGKDIKPCLFTAEIEAFIVSQSVELPFEALDEEIAAFQSPFDPSSDKVWREVMEQQKSYYRLSATHLNNFNDCRLLFYFQSFIKVPNDVNPYQKFGTAIHKALELFHKAHHYRKTIPSKEELNAWFTEAIQKNDATPDEKELYLHKGHKLLELFYENELENDSFSPKTLAEISFKNQEVFFEGLALDGKIDRVDFISPKEVEVIDYKTGTLKPDKLQDFSKERRQLVFYQLLWNLAPKTEAKMLKGTLIFLEEETHKQRQSFVVSDKDLEQLKDEIRVFQDAFKNLDFFNPDTWCKTCDYCKVKLSGGR